MITHFSKIIAGTMTWGIWGKNLNNKEMIETINCCVSNNICSFDHADIYGAYTTETSFGSAFKESKLDRNIVQFISKCGIQYDSGNRNNRIKHYDYSKKNIIWSVENSLKNLKTDYLNLLLLHRPSPLMQVDEIAEAIEKLKFEGKILDFGLSNFTTSQTTLLQTKIKISFNQIQFSAIQTNAMLDGSLDFMQSNNIIPMAWNPLGSVFKNNFETDDKIVRVKDIVEKMAIKYSVTPDIILISWILKHPANIIPICGTTNKSRIQNLMKATTLDIDLQDWFEIWTESLGSKVP